MAEPKRKKTGKVTTDPHTQIFNEVLEGMAYAKLKPTEWQFIMVLWRLTYGRKNMDHKIKGAGGQWTTWSNAEFHLRTGLPREVISRTKAALLKKKVIKQKQGMIGFNKHFDKWSRDAVLTKQSILTNQSKLTKRSILTKQSKLTKQSTSEYGLNSQQSLTKQSTKVDQTVNIDAPKPTTPAHLQTLKKERKKEILGEGAEAPDKSLSNTEGKEEKKDPVFTAFSRLWNRYFYGGRDTRGENFRTTLATYRKYVDGESVTFDEVHAALLAYKDKMETQRMDYKYYKSLTNWLKGEEWLDLRGPKKTYRQELEERMDAQDKKLKMGKYRQPPE